MKEPQLVTADKFISEAKRNKRVETESGRNEEEEEEFCVCVLGRVRKGGDLTKSLCL